jgi:hypothetical protein
LRVEAKLERGKRAVQVDVRVQAGAPAELARAVERGGVVLQRTVSAYGPLTSASKSVSISSSGWTGGRTW